MRKMYGIPSFFILYALATAQHAHSCTGDEHVKYIKEVRFDNDKLACGSELKRLVIKWSSQAPKGSPKPNGIGLVVKNAKGKEIVRYDLPETKPDSLVYATCINKHYAPQTEIRFYFSEFTNTRTEKNGSVSQTFAINPKNESCVLSELLTTP
ncbi:MAG TPA: hypothetical protein PKE57_12005 [Cellvibrionaceae bacterium]|nr:hypothetical protein [Cellvibrionaceae bacterium]HMW48106.1 hypothetical protein [Cellvibrionaceae bacterium]HMW72783.1 hypothetical protein [Cellvibrionaceae bacterium]HMY40678.1 hypothetical protein [Marinagarivorans sp.]HNG61042.1 hypothetical protein [Cellvibrionaceae bacterium]